MQSQILVQIIMHATVIYVSKMPDDMVENMHMIPAHSIDEAIKKAKAVSGKEDIKINAIPDGIAVIVKN